MAIEKMKQGKSAGPTGVVAEMHRAAGEAGALWMTVVKDVCHIHQLQSLRRSLTIESSHALVLSRLDYCNGLLGEAPKCLLGPLSGVLRVLQV